MIDVFERLAPAYGRVVRKFALDVWYDRANVNEFLHKADYFKRRYTSELIEYFKHKRYAFNPKQIKELSDRWLADQVTTSRKLVTLSNLKKGKLASELINLNEESRREAIELYEQSKTPTEGRVSRVVSFADNLEARAVQIGEDSAFELGREINDFTVMGNSDCYDWNTQEDNLVRMTHRMLARKTFSYDNPPTTIDRYGRRHTGNCGSDWGCRCWATTSKKKPLLNFIARER